MPGKAQGGLACAALKFIVEVLLVILIIPLGKEAYYKKGLIRLIARYFMAGNREEL